MKLIRNCLLLCLFLCLGCSNPPQSSKAPTSPKQDAQPVQNPQTVQQDQQIEAAVKETEKKFNPFFIYADKGYRANHFVPSGFMPNGKCLKMNDRWTENCQSGRTCIMIEYDVTCSMEDQNWSGIYWLNPPNNWGNRKGGFNLTGAKKLSFWGKGAQGGERIEEFKVGGITGDYPDTDMAMIGPVILTDEWREYSIDLRGKDLSYISGGFSWATNVDVNPEKCTFYLDNIRYE